MEKPLVTIQCLVYNHEPYLRQCLDGFVMQKTNFPFEAVVHDDASTDHSADIIREYATKYPNIIKPIYETENQWSKYDGSLERIMDEACTGKYIAICEGDDYWIDPNKLQKQVDTLINNKSCSMVCCRTRFYSERLKEFIGENRCFNKSTILKPQDVILKGGEYISTASIVYRKDIKNNYPEYCVNCNVGDYPLQIMCAMKGNIYYIDIPMAIYRVDNPLSWCGIQAKKVNVINKEALKRKSSIQLMLDGFSKDFPKYKSIFRKRISFSINSEINRKTPKTKARFIVREFYSPFIKFYTPLWKIDLYIRLFTPRILLGLYTKFTAKVFLKKYYR